MKKWIVFATILLVSMLLLEASILSVDAKHKCRKPKKWKHMGLVYKECYTAETNITYITNSNVLADDPNISLTFTLTKGQVALILYTVENGINVGSSHYGGRQGIMVDGVDVAGQRESHRANGGRGGDATVIYAALLTAGPHVVKGRLATNLALAFTTVFNTRKMIVLIFDGTAADFAFVESLVVDTSNVAVLGNDAPAVINLNLPTAQKALILYATTTFYNAAGPDTTNGRKMTVAVDGVDGNVTMQGNAYYVAGVACPETEFYAEVRTLSAGVHTIQGRHACNVGGGTSRIDERQLAVLLFDTTLETDYAESLNSVSVIGNALGDDTPAQVSRNIPATRYLLAIYCASKRYNVDHTDSGQKLAINLNGTDYSTVQRCCQGAGVPPIIAERVDSTEIDFLGVAAGNYTVKGRFASLTGAPDQATVNARTFSLLWFSSLTPPPPPPLDAQETQSAQQVTNQTTFGMTRLRMRRRITRIIPWVA